ncbi:BZ3500_MvSof-1268-A1-R1_Chr2-2g04968 [Microbotryum saponariae]|uniref:BZ3500_MvSof-1268-A1-R1_Chr2-2g04968 protein n=1 Tax=Microbotryum saponariae TaxID=289078 RepID=A0A2X0K4B4_9BASI|nr:BZ3500_MvSof-1268-A1-R1_Chr2-2g04968 [Microbotryum saponariae]SDA00590.1 BZ3501_MvSof-1269-A2-R1_Chr2-2g04642 [Microbotryum saponariae]
MATPTRLAKSVLRRNPLLSFLSRESPSSINSIAAVAGPSTSTSTASFLPYTSSNPSVPSPFSPTKKSGDSRQWNAPKYSLRRQKKLFVSAVQQGYDPASLLPPPHKNHQPKPTRPLLKFKSSPFIPETSVLDQVGLTKMGPYKGRKALAFKGKIWERNKQQRLNQLETLLQASPVKERTWRDGLKSEKKKGKAAL